MPAESLFQNLGVAFIYGIITFFVLALITSWVAGLNIKNAPKKEEPSNVVHH